MTLLKVKKRKPFPFQGQILEGGVEVDSRNFPNINSDKWAQLIDHGFFDLVDKPGADLNAAIAERRASAQLERARQTVENTAEAEVRFTAEGPVDAPIVDKPIQVKATGQPGEFTEPKPQIECPDCGHIAKNAHGLLVHVGRKHPTKE